LLRVVVVATAVLVGLIAWTTSRDDGDDASSPAAVEPGLQIVSEAELIETAAGSGQPIYWVGPVPGTELELREVAGGGYQIRYLPAGEAGSAELLTVGTYPLPDPAKSLEDFAKQPGAIARTSGDGREVVTNEENPSSVYFVSPDNSVQVEVYDPTPKRAMGLALSARVEPIG